MYNKITSHDNKEITIEGDIKIFVAPHKILFVDCIYVTIRKEYESKNYAVYTFLGYDLDGQKALDPVCCSVCYPCSGIFERYFFCKCFVATVALISMDKEVPYVCSTSPYWNIFEFDLSVFINIYTVSAIRAPDCLR